jgi:hypothetical protein
LTSTDFDSTKVPADRINLAAEKTRILGYIAQLENEQITCAVATNDLDGSNYGFNYNYTFDNLLSTGNRTTVVNSFSDAVYTLSAAVTITVNSDTTQLLRSAASSGRIPSAQISFYRYMDAVYNNIRIGGQMFTSRYRDLFLNELQASFLFMAIYYACQVTLILVAAVILIKHVFEVMNKNKEVMTLFAMIERNEIVKLKEECQAFLTKHIGNLFETDSESSEKEDAGRCRSAGDNSDSESGVDNEADELVREQLLRQREQAEADMLIQQKLLQEKARIDNVATYHPDPHARRGQPGSSS